MAADTHGLCAHGKGLDDIGAAAKAAVHQRRHLRAGHFDDLRQCVDCGTAAVVDEDAAVRDSDAINERGDVAEFSVSINGRENSPRRAGKSVSTENVQKGRNVASCEPSSSSIVAPHVGTARRHQPPMRTSLTHPLMIAEVQAKEGQGRIGITFCPGKHQSEAVTSGWRRNLGVDLDAICDWGATAVSR